MRYTITGADRETGRDAVLTLVAASAEEAEHIATKQGMLVASVRPERVKEEHDDAEGSLPLWGEEQVTDPETPAPLPTTVLGHNLEQAAPPAGAEEAHAERPHFEPPTAPAAAQYHVIQNPALYLLETAVSKHMKEGWEPLGGIQVSNWNNQIQFYQALVRRKA